MDKRKLSTWIAFLGGLSLVMLAIISIAMVWVKDENLMTKLLVSDIISVIFLGLFYIISREIED